MSDCLRRQRLRAMICVWACLSWVGIATAQNSQVPRRRQVAITFDDLPVAQSGKSACDEPGLSNLTQQLLTPYRDNSIPLTAFVIAGNCPKLSAAEKAVVLGRWIASGAELGNHTFSHRGMNNTPIEDYEQDILRADRELKQILGLSRLRYFRSPMLQTGPTPEAKQKLEDFLKAHNYEQSPVTLDNSDWIFANVYSSALASQDSGLATRVRNAYIPYMESVIEFFERRSVEVVGREFPQILLVHSSRLNADTAPNLIAMLKRREYTFVSLETALRDPTYNLPNTYSGTGGFSWIHRWSRTKGMPNKGEPEPPDWIMTEFGNLQ
jgi:peptidoglycan-N-acetylglucosamine deacetylase